jgi:hypothetical protein
LRFDAVPTPTFSEANHPLIKSLCQQSDQDLLTLFQRYPEAGQYFVTLFCRYSPMIYPVVGRSARSPVQADYLFALIWRHVFNELGGLDLRLFGAAAGPTPPTFQSWLLNTTATCIKQIELPAVEDIHYDLQAAPPPFWCYLDRCLDEMPADLRLMIVMSQTYSWSETRIAAYLQAEGDRVSPAEVKRRVEEGYKILQARLPEDIRSIYLDGNPKG